MKVTGSFSIKIFHPTGLLATVIWLSVQMYNPKWPFKEIVQDGGGYP